MPTIVSTHDEIQKYNGNGTFFITGVFSVELPFLYTNIALSLCVVLFVLTMVYLCYFVYVVKLAKKTITAPNKSLNVFVKELPPIKAIKDEIVKNEEMSSKKEKEKENEDYVKESQSQLKASSLAPTARQAQISNRYYLPASSPQKLMPSRLQVSQISMINNSLSVIEDNFSATSLNAPSRTSHNKEQKSESSSVWTSPSNFRHLLKAQWPKQIYEEETATTLPNPFDDQESVWSTQTALRDICKAQIPGKENTTATTIVKDVESVKNADLDNKEEEVKIVKNNCGIIVESVTELANEDKSEDKNENQGLAHSSAVTKSDEHFDTAAADDDGKEFGSKVSSIEKISSSKRSSLKSIQSQSGLSHSEQSEYDNSMKKTSILQSPSETDEKHIFVEQQQSSDTIVNEFESVVSETPSNFMHRLQSSSNKSLGSSQKQSNAMMSEDELSTSKTAAGNNPSNSTVDLLIKIEAHECLSSSQNEISSSCTGAQIESNRTSIDEKESNRNNNNNKSSVETSLTDVVNVKFLNGSKQIESSATTNVRSRIEQFENSEFKKSSNPKPTFRSTSTKH